ncbi:MAG: hypothetical protein JNN02_04340, partial [Tabrizicola sp.]|nr:hypothetical protein [Tabrizicola sp.]
LGAGFDWGEVDLLLLNPDGADRIFIDYGEGAQMAQVSDLQAELVVNVGDSSGDILVPVTTINYRADTTISEPEWQGVEAGYYQVIGYAGGYDGHIFASMRVVDDELVVFEHKIGETTYITAQEIGWEEIDDEPVVTQALALGIGLFGDGWNGETDTVYDLSAAKGASDWVELGEDEFIQAHYFSSEQEAPTLAGGNWLFLNGGLGEGGSIANGGAISADMAGVTAPNLSDWLLAA